MELLLNKTWEECLKMWAWISRKSLKEEDADLLKYEYIKSIGINPNTITLWHNCFFCEYAVLRRPTKKEYTDNKAWYIYGNGCRNCPGKLVDPDFDCRNSEYRYDKFPRKFYKKLKKLNKKRLSNKK